MTTPCADCGTTRAPLCLQPRYGTPVPVCQDRPACEDRVRQRRLATFVRACSVDFRRRSREAGGRETVAGLLFGRGREWGRDDETKSV